MININSSIKSEGKTFDEAKPYFSMHDLTSKG